jgi:hypothetical protein
MRRGHPTLTSYLERNFKGSQSDGKYIGLYNAARSVDMRLELAYSRFGFPGVKQMLAQDDTVEMGVSQLASAFYLQRHRDPIGAANLLAEKPPGMEGVAPDWAIANAQDAAKSAYKEAERLGSRAPPVDGIQGQGADGRIQPQQGQTWAAKRVAKKRAGPRKS